jgi:hypothetical protein
LTEVIAHQDVIRFTDKNAINLPNESGVFAPREQDRMYRNSLLSTLVFGFVFAFSAFAAPLFAQSEPVVQRVAPNAGTYAVPQGWREERSDTDVILSVPGALIYLWLNRNDKRETWQAATEFAGNQIEDKNFKWTVVSKNIYRYGEQEVSKVTLDMEAKGRPKRQEFILAIPVQNGILFMLVNVIEAKLGEYEEAINSVMNPLLPVAAADPKPYPASNSTVGLRLLVSPTWNVAPISLGENSGAAYLEIKRGNALLSLSSKQDSRSPKEYVSEVEKNIKQQCKKYDKLGEATEVVAGIQGTRLELRTTTTSDIPIRRWVVVFSRDNRHYVVAAAAPESEFDQFASDFKQMIASIALSD